MSENGPIQRFLNTDPNNSGLLVQRVVLGFVMFPHGAQKLLGWFGGYGFSGTMGFFTNTMHLPSPIAFLVIVGEFFGALLLLVGGGTRLAAFGISAIMIGAALTTHLQVGFFMNWFGVQQGEGFEFHLLALALSVPLTVWGGGRYALDTILLQRTGAESTVREARTA
jgi:putative oxidoreductase